MGSERNIEKRLPTLVPALRKVVKAWRGRRYDGASQTNKTKGREDLDVPLKVARLKQWCDDVNQAQDEARYDFAFVDEEGFKEYRPATFAALAAGFREYK